MRVNKSCLVLAGLCVPTLLACIANWEFAPAKLFGALSGAFILLMLWVSVERIQEPQSADSESSARMETR